jgi:hypothetical protein
MKYYLLPFLSRRILHLQIKEMLEKLDQSLKAKDGERKAYKEKHGIMTQEERERMMKNQSSA